MSQSLIAHFVPFRSSRFHDLPRQKQSVCQLWMMRLSSSLFVWGGRRLRDLIPTALLATQIKTECWGKYEADIDTLATHGPNY